MTTDEEFEQWFKIELSNGLTNFHVSVNPLAEGVTPEKIKRAILDSEKAIREGRFTEFQPKD